MNTYYTKEQMDFLAEEIGKRLKQTSSQETIKLKYESNPNTNAFTDNHKTILEALQGLAPATSIESFLEAFTLAMGTTAAAQASVLILRSSKTIYANTAFHAEYQVNDEPWVTRTFNGTAEETPE